MRRTRTRRRKDHGGRPRRGATGREGPPRRRAPLWTEEGGAAWPRLLNHLIRFRDRDLTFWQILEDLGLGEDRADGLREQMAVLEKADLLAHHRRGRFRLHSRDRLVVGRLSIPDRSREIGRHWGASGAFGFVSTAAAEGDLYLPARGIAGARHGDTVLARAVASRRSGRTQGEVVAIVQRAPSRFGGEVITSGGRLRIRPRDDRRAREVDIIDPAGGPGRLESEEGHRRGAAQSREEAGEPVEPAALPKSGDLVVADLDEERPDRARIVQVIGPADAPDAAERLVRAEMDLPGAFPPEVEEEAARAGTALGAEDLEGRTDFRSLVTITIDPVDARDFDDAVGLEHLEGGAVRLWVHIADVARYVLPGSALDREALARGTSVYFPSSVIPMLPHGLSSGICSLREGEDRLVQSVGIDYTRDAEVKAVRFVDGVIRSTARLSYEEAAAAMEDPSTLACRGEAGRAAAALLASLAPLARRLTRKRVRRGALDLDLPEVEFDPGKEGIPVALRAHERTDAHRLIEEFMLAANEAVARHLSDRASPSLHRVHEPPDPRDVEEIEKSLAGLGLSRARSGTLAVRMQRILSTFRGRPGELIIARHLLRAMKLARYAAAPAGHFGLALTHYTHFTSPIRRYPDLIVHRILRAERRAAGDGAAGGREGSGGLGAGTEKGGYEIKDLEPIAAESSRLERRAESAERAVNDLLVARMIRPRTGEIFEGRVSGKVKTGIFVAFEGEGIPHGAAEGFVPARRAAEFVLTEPVTVRLEEADLLRGRLRLSLVES